MAKENGGVIGVLNTPSTTTASGVWALQDQYEAKRNNNWPLTPFVSSNSARFNSGSSDSLQRTTGTPTSRRIFTFSGWLKRSNLGTFQQILTFQDSADGDPRTTIGFRDTDTLQFQTTNSAGAGLAQLTTTALYRDISAWYHIVVAIDTTQATASNRAKLYVNGTQVTSFSTETYPSQNADLDTNLNRTYIGRLDNNSATNFFNGYMSEIYYIDGQQLTPSSFGASNASGVWYPIPYAGSYGTNGFNLKFTNASSLGADSSPNGNNFTVNNLTSVDQSTDTELNNFATMNPLYKWTYNLTLTEGNLSCAGTQNQWQGAIGSIGISKGKWYYEVKFTSATNVGDFYIGFGGLDNFVPGSPAFRNGVAFYNFDGGEVNVADTSNTTVTTANYGTFANGDIMGVALDYDNELITIYKNGSAIVTNFDYGAATYPSTLINGKTISPVVGHYGSGSVSFNFGSPPYAANSFADGNGYGNFSYAVPSGYYALCTANLNTYG